MILGTNVPQGEDLFKIELLDLVVGISNSDRGGLFLKIQIISKKTEDELYLSKLKEINKQESNLINVPLFGETTFEIEVSDQGVVSHIDEIKELGAYSYLFSEQCGKIHGVVDVSVDSSSPTPADGLSALTILDISDMVDCENEKGLHTFNTIEIATKNYLLVTYLRK